MRVFLFSTHHDCAEIEADCSEHNLFGSLPANSRMSAGEIKYTVQVGDRVQSWYSNENFDHFKTLIENIY